MHPNSLANLNRFTAGESGNPSGNHTGTKHRSTIVKKWIEVESEFKNPISKTTQRMTVEDAMTLAMIGAVIAKQNVQAYNALKDEVYGKLTDKTEHSFDFSNLSDEELKQLESVIAKLT